LDHAEEDGNEGVHNGGMYHGEIEPAMGKWSGVGIRGQGAEGGAGDTQLWSQI
jgi:hypothetical protein